MRNALRWSISLIVRSAALLVGAHVSASPLGAQSRPVHTLNGAVVGDVVRYRTVGSPKTWTTVRVVDGDSAVLVGVPIRGDSTPRRVSADSLRDIELNLGRRSRGEALARNLGKTALAGGITTLALAGLFEASESEGDFFSGDMVGTALGLAATAGAASIVTVHSLASPGQKWRRLPLRTKSGVLPVVRRSQLTGWNVGVKFKVR